ncbi:MAG: M18 family aminopeptidase [Lachnospiraceae bacterium]|nr:M18 family aminopeptidase [Lachnospiraceae bacterium]
MSKEVNCTEGLLAFIDQSPSAYHVVENIRNRLLEQSFIELKEAENWSIKSGKGYFVVRNGSSIIAFRMPRKQPKGFHIVASHSDSPTFKVKENAQMTVEEHYIKVNTEKYGGMILSTWLDRPLSVAGRIAVKTADGEMEQRTVKVDKDLLVIPNLAIHMNRDVNKGYEYNPQTDMLPLMALTGEEERSDLLLEEVATAAGVKPEEILGHDLFLYVREKGRVLGAHGEFVHSPRLDDLQCVYASLEAFANAKPKQYTNVLAVFDNEEVGSGTAQGADSTFLQDVLLRIGEALEWNHGEYCRRIAESYLVSADNAHAVHPNHPQKADPTNRPYLGGGIVIKYHGSQRYTTDAVSAARMKLLCEKAKVPYQTYTNRSDIVGGGTLGNISTAHVSLNSVDIGLPQLAMHSAVETAGSRDTAYAIEVLTLLYEE